MFDRLRLDFVQAFRVFTHQRGFTMAALLTIALGAGANATVFSLVNAILLRPMPIGEPGRTVNVHATDGEDRWQNFSYVEYRMLRERTRSIRALAAYDEANAVLQLGNASQRMTGQMVSANYFDVVARRPAAGRFFNANEEAVGAPPVVVLSYSTWQNQFEGNTAIIGRPITLGGNSFTVIGVAPREFRGLFRGVDYTFWVPLGTHALFERNAALGDRMNDRGGWLSVVGLLNEGIDRRAAQTELSQLRVAISREQRFGDDVPATELFPLTGLPDRRRAPIVAFMGVLTAVSALVLLTACVNLAGMLIGRGLTRSREIALRVALGANRGALVRQLLVEVSLLLIAGAALGALIATWSADLLLAFLPVADVTLVLDVGIDLRVIAYTFGSVLLAGVLVGLFPILQMSRPNLVESLKASSNTIAGGRMRLRRVMVGAQIAVSLLLVVVAGLFARSLGRASNVDPGFDTENLLAAMVDVGPTAKTPEQGLALYASLEDKLRARPDVEDVAFSLMLPLTQSSRGQFVLIPGAETRPGEPSINVNVNVVSPNYMRTMHIPMLRGREFTNEDRRDGRSVVIVNQTVVDRYFRNRDPVGTTIHETMTDRDLLIVGVAANIRFRSLAAEQDPFIYLPMSQEYESEAYLHVRTRNPDDVLRSLQEILRAVEPSAAVFSAAMFERHIGIVLVPQKIAGSIAGVFSLVGVLLAGLGLYAVVSFWTLQRKRELAVRTALGAMPSELIGMVTREGLRMVAGGAVVGLAAAFLFTRLLRAFLFGVSPLDPVVFLAALTALTLVLLVACVGPVRRTLRLEPMNVLRE